MNSLDINLLKYECIENQLETDVNQYYAPNIDNNLWSSSTVVPIHHIHDIHGFQYPYNQYIQHNNSQQLIGIYQSFN